MRPLKRLAIQAGAFAVATGGTALAFAAMLILNADAPIKAATPKATAFELEPVVRKTPPKQEKKAPPKQERQAPARAEARVAPASVGSELSGVDLGMPGLGGAGVTDLGKATDLAGGGKSAQDLVMSEGAVDAPPKAVERSQPTYPPRARAEGVEGSVTVSLLVAADGSVEQAKVVRAEPAGVFDAAALEAVRAWRFEPATYSGKPVKVWARQVVRFALM
jgi:protein TonB